MLHIHAGLCCFCAILSETLQKLVWSTAEIGAVRCWSAWSLQNPLYLCQGRRCTSFPTCICIPSGSNLFMNLNLSNFALSVGCSENQAQTSLPCSSMKGYSVSLQRKIFQPAWLCPASWPCSRGLRMVWRLGVQRMSKAVISSLAAACKPVLLRCRQACCRQELKQEAWAGDTQRVIF